MKIKTAKGIFGLPTFAYGLQGCCLLKEVATTYVLVLVLTLVEYLKVIINLCECNFYRCY